MFESPGPQRNTQYEHGLELILNRLAERGYRLADAQVISRDTSTLSNEELRLVVDQMPYPMQITDASALRRRLSRAITKVGRAPGAKGSGNPNKRIRLWLDGPATAATELATWLASGEGASSQK